MTVRIYKLIGGEDVIASVKENTPNFVVLQDPATIIIQNDGSGRMGLGLAPYAPYAKDGTTTLFLSAVAAVCTPDLKLENEYNRLFGSGIEIMTSSIKV